MVLKADWRETITIRRRRERDHLLHLSPFYSNESTSNVLSSFADYLHHQVIQEVFKSFIPFIRDWYTILQLPHHFNHRHICFGGKTNRCHRRGVDTVAATTSTQYINGSLVIFSLPIIYLPSYLHRNNTCNRHICNGWVLYLFFPYEWNRFFANRSSPLVGWMLNNKRCIEFFDQSP